MNSERKIFSLKKFIGGDASFIAFVVIVIIAALGIENFFTYTNLMNLLKQTSTIGIMAIGMSFVIIAGGIDLSVGSTYAFAGVICGLVITKVTNNAFLGVLIALICCTAIGLINGLLIVKLNIISFITTLCMMNAVYGVGMLMTEGGKSIAFEGAFFDWLYWGKIGFLPVSGCLLILAYVIAAIVGKYREFGRDCYSIGGNSMAALMKGVPVDRVRIMTYALMGLCAGIAGIVVSTRTGTGQISVGSGQEMNVIAACVIGGIPLSGGEGKPLNALWGALIIGVIGNIINLNSNISFLLQGCITGGIMIVILLAQSIMARSHKISGAK